MKTNKKYSVVVLLILSSLFLMSECTKSQDLATELKIINLFSDSTQSGWQRFGYFSQKLGQTIQDIKYIYSETYNFSNCDTLETSLIGNNYLIKIIDNQGLVMTITITKYRSTDDLFDGYVDWSTPIWNEINPNIINSEHQGENLDSFYENEYKHDAFYYLASECGVFAGWIPVIPADFISQRDTTSTGSEERIIHFKTVEPLSNYCSKNLHEPLLFHAEYGIDKDFKDLQETKYSKKY